ncbi:winged helix-turn-helix transcriptional regulator [Actinomyces haliotis]|uniref:winged helix-turn-helix transcriptional regulator n=1 Tax=Actinomyces haliotis TaxID=1280843 RepID=UPI002B278786|nr:helix-turn-helix domain-containing protein [Actinomyces haliotis]
MTGAATGPSRPPAIEVRGLRRHFTVPERRLERVTAVDGVLAKMLTQTLRGLERDGLVEREQFPDIPPRVTYRLTGTGRSLAAALGGVQAWAITHMGEVESAREHYDAKG